MARAGGPGHRAHGPVGLRRHFSRHPLRYRLWTRLSWFNTRHQSFAWASLVSVTLTDVYIMSVSAGWIADLRLLN